MTIIIEKMVPLQISIPMSLTEEMEDVANSENPADESVATEKMSIRDR